MKTIFLSPALALALALGLAHAVPAPSVAADAPPANRFAMQLTAAERFEVGNLQVERYGSRNEKATAGKPPMILIPGLASGAWAWQDMVRRFSSDHAVYVVTLPGFDGRPAAGGPQFDKARQALRQLIVSRKLDHPYVIGHSLGGTLAIALAESDSALLGGIASVDGLAVMPGSEQAPAAMRSQMAAGMKARMAAADPRQFALQQQQYMRGIGVTDLAAADELARLSARSDPGAVVDMMAEVVEQDLRPGLRRISVPVLLVAPYFEADAVQRGLTQDMVKGYYTSLMQGTPALTVLSIAPSRHFVMFDQPEALADALRDFMARR